MLGAKKQVLLQNLLRSSPSRGESEKDRDEIYSKHNGYT